jgi:hypothetical protein
MSQSLRSHAFQIHYGPANEPLVRFYIPAGGRGVSQRVGQSPMGRVQGARAAQRGCSAHRASGV